MLFDPEATKPAQEVIFSRKKDDCSSKYIFNDIPVERVSHQKHLGIYLDKKFKFQNAY